MTEKELRDNILLVMLKYRDKYHISIDDFCLENKIDFSSIEQKKRIFKSLNDQGYIQATFFINGDGDFSVTSSGVDYAENLLEIRAKGPRSTGEDPRKNNGPIGGGNTGNHTDEDVSNNKGTKLYQPVENNKSIIDNSVDACFGVKELAQCFVRLIDSASLKSSHNVCMIGIFAPWGRGKTYFFNRVKDVIKERSLSSSIQYDVVEFNAWKYQETPAIWAYLYETLYNSRYKARRYNLRYRARSWRHRTGYTIKRNIKSMSWNFLIALIITLMAYSIKKIDSFLGKYTIGVTSVVGLIVYWWQQNYNSAISFLRKYTKEISFANELGVQAEIEKEITSLLESWIHKNSVDKKRVLLYVDDIDRCSETKMISILDSLRTVLENEEIRKRLIIICSIDPEKIIKGIEYKYRELYKEKDLHNIAIDQMDKIFLTGIALPQLDDVQLEEFVTKLTQSKNTENYTQNTELPYNIGRETGAFVTGHMKDDEKILDDSKIAKELSDLIESRPIKNLTPRKIRVIYYRILLANNILSIGKETKMTSNIIGDIFDLSVGKKNKDVENKVALTDVVNMVVPYRKEIKENIIKKK